jgi:GNAT superfamily N-acetyltransferase
VRIRRARVADAEALTDIARAAKASWGYPDAWLTAWESVLTLTADYLRTNQVLVAEEGGERVGFASLEDGPSGPEIGHLWVAPARQGHGVGRALVRRVLLEARRRGWDSVRVESDPNARPFYERLGGIWIGEVAAPVAGTERRLPVLQLPVA